MMSHHPQSALACLAVSLLLSLALVSMTRRQIFDFGMNYALSVDEEEEEMIKTFNRLFQKWHPTRSKPNQIEEEYQKARRLKLAWEKYRKKGEPEGATPEQRDISAI